MDPGTATQLGAAAFLIGEYVYHSYFDDPPKPHPAPELTLPRVDKGAAYPIIYGRCRVRAGVPAWCDNPLFDQLTSGSALEAYLGAAPSGGSDVYFMSTLMILGIPFLDGQQTLYGIWAGDSRFQHFYDGGSDTHNVQPWQLKGDGTDYGTRWARLTLDTTGRLGTGRCFGAIEFLAGGTSQVIVDVPGPSNAHWNVAYNMTRSGGGGTHVWDKFYGTWPVSDVPGYRGFLGVGLYGQQILGVGPAHWLVGESAAVPQYSFEVRSLPTTSLGPSTSVDSGDGVGAPAGDANTAYGTYIGGANDANPVDVLYDIITSPFGKLGLPTSRIDAISFAAAATTLANEGHGISRAWEGGQTAAQMIAEVLLQIDGVLFEDPTTGTIKLKLIRNDYTVSALPLIDPSNCTRLENFAAGGWTGIPNKVRLTFTNRADGYRDGSAQAQSLANFVGQDGEAREVNISMLGITTAKLASATVDRELARRSRPLIKCTAVVDRTLVGVNPGDAVRLKWPEYGLTETVMRVASAGRGTRESPEISLTLLQDYFYIWRLSNPSAVFARPRSAGIYGGTL